MMSHRHHTGSTVGLSPSGVGSRVRGIPGSRIKGSIDLTYSLAHSSSTSSRVQIRLVRSALQLADTAFHCQAVLGENSHLLPSSGLVAKHLSKLVANGFVLRLVYSRLPTDLTLRPGLLLVLPAPDVFHSARLDLSEDHAQGFFKRPALPIPPATRPSGQLVLPSKRGSELVIRKIGGPTGFRVWL